MQNVSLPFVDSTANWQNHETNTSVADNALTFGVGALSLAPGETVYAPVSLRTVANSLAADVTLQTAQPAMVNNTAFVDISDPGDKLWDAIRVSVYTSSTAGSPASACSSATIASWSTAVISNSPLDSYNPVADSQSLSANGESTQHYCFVITLPGDALDLQDLQGRTIAPAWEFKSVVATP